MEDYFELPVTYKGEELLLKGRLAAFTYVYKFYITVNDMELEFERDDNGEFRVISSEGGEGNVDRNLIAAIIDVLEKLQTM
ncbi:hypothetical protein [Parachryseolinea silvisoli]|uniref:hypothetical protein n=1 Tax=Parachryseolinea silvisoli TaxID=2873601 RepID=UPI002265818F|nr:hypothetical protein [Parachryseolinea silvisoli]MCD9019163.1 hypothetical protein [Parachryseolinea silvisoli]